MDSAEWPKRDFKGYAIIYHELDGVWFCPELDVRASALGEVKKAIDGFIKSERSVKNVPALSYDIGGIGGSLRIDEVQITILCEPVSNGPIRECWIREVSGRRKMRLSSLIAPERRAELEAAAALYADAANKYREAGDLLDRIPRLDAKDVLARAGKGAEPHDE